MSSGTYQGLTGIMLLRQLIEGGSKKTCLTFQKHVNGYSTMRNVPTTIVVNFLKIFSNFTNELNSNGGKKLIVYVSVEMNTVPLPREQPILGLSIYQRY